MGMASKLKSGIFFFFVFSGKAYSDVDINTVFRFLVILAAS